MKLFNRYFALSSLITVLILLPIAALFLFSLGHGTGTLKHLADTVLSEYILNTLQLILCVSVLALVFGILSAYFTSFYDFPLAKVFSILLALPFVIPTYILGYIYGDILGFFGPVHLFFKGLGIIDKGFFNVLQFNSVAVILALGLYPYIYLIVKASFLKSSSALHNVALSLGKNRWELFYKVILPLSRPAIIGSLALVIMEVVNEYGAVAYYGVDTLSTAIYSSWFALNDPASSAVLSIIAMSIIFILLLIEKYSRKQADYKIEAISKEIKKVPLEPWQKVSVYSFLSIPVLFGFIIPFIWITIYTYKYAASVLNEEFISTVLHSFISASLSSFMIILFALIISYTIRISQTKSIKYLSKVAGIGYAIPGVVIGVGMITLLADVDHRLIKIFHLDELLLSGTLFALSFGYTVRFLAVGLNMVESSHEKISININKAARNLGKNYWQTLLFIELPLLKKTLLFGFLLVFVDIIKELPLTLVLRPFNYETLSTKTYEYATNMMIQQSAVYAFVIIILCFIPVILSNRK